MIIFMGYLWITKYFAIYISKKVPIFRKFAYLEGIFNTWNSKKKKKKKKDKCPKYMGPA